MLRPLSTYGRVALGGDRWSGSAATLAQRHADVRIVGATAAHPEAAARSPPSHLIPA
jgi:hypothetical protein